MVKRYGQADIPREVSGRVGPAVCPAAADFPQDICLTEDLIQYKDAILPGKEFSLWT